MVEIAIVLCGKITWSFRNENWSCRRPVFGLKISLEPWQKVVVSGGSMPQQRQRGSSQQTSSSSRTTAYIQPYTPPYPLSIPLPFPFQRSPHLHRHLRSSPFHVPLLYLRALRASSSLSLSLSFSFSIPPFLSLHPNPSLSSFSIPPSIPTALSSFARGRSNTATKRHGCTYENVTHIST